MENIVRNSLIQDPTLEHIFEQTKVGSRNHPINLDPLDNELNPLHNPSLNTLESPTEVRTNEYMDEDLREQELEELDL